MARVVFAHARDGYFTDYICSGRFREDAGYFTATLFPGVLFHYGARCAGKEVLRCSNACVSPRP